MGRINNGNWVSQHRKIQGKFQNKQDIEAYLFDKKLSNGNNIQENNRLNTDDLPNIPAILEDYEATLSRQSIIEPIDGSKAHTPATQAFLTALTTLSVISLNITASSKKYISTDSQNSLSHTVKSFTEVSKTPVLFDTTAASTSTSQNHDESKGSTKHNDNQYLIRGKRSWDNYLQLDCLHVNSVSLDTKFIKRQLKENLTGLCLTNVRDIDSQKAQEIATLLKNSNINYILFNYMNITDSKELMAVLKDTNINVLQLSPGAISATKPTETFAFDYISKKNLKYIQEIIKVLKDTNVEKLILTNNYLGDEKVIDIIKSLKEVGSKVKMLNLTNNMISNKGAEKIAPELRGTELTQVILMQNPDIKYETLQKIYMVLEDNIHVNAESSTSTMEFSSTKEESSKDISGKQEKKEDLTTSKENIIETLEPIAEDSTTPTPKESNPNNPTSSTISIGEPVGLTALAVSIISAIVGAVVYVTKKFCDGKKSYTHYDLPLAELISDSHLNSNKDIPNQDIPNQDIPLTGVVVDEGI